jgi:hypothetical protein
MNKHKVGDLVAIVRYAHVKEVDQKGDVQVQDVDDKSVFTIRGAPIVDSLKSAAITDKEEKVTLTEAATLVSTSFNTPVTVCFDKQEGGERVLVGRLLSTEPLLGRSHFEDLEIQEGHRLRLVDHRTIKWAIINRTKYVVGKKKR